MPKYQKLTRIIGRKITCISIRVKDVLYYTAKQRIQQLLTTSMDTVTEATPTFTIDLSDIQDAANLDVDDSSEEEHQSPSLQLSKNTG